MNGAYGNATYSPNLTEGENQLLAHYIRYGSDGYPVQKVKGGWLWTEMYGIKGAPTVYKTKKSCHAAIEAYIHILIGRRTGRDEPSLGRTE